MQYPATIQDPANGLADFVYRRLGGASPDWNVRIELLEGQAQKVVFDSLSKSSHELRQLQDSAESGLLTSPVAAKLPLTRFYRGARKATSSCVSSMKRVGLPKNYPKR
jgi:hypothetical protein